MTTPAQPADGVEALLPCPFCGGEAERIDFGPGDAENEGGSCIACKQCQSNGPVEFGRKENFVANWNRRTLAASRGEAVATVCLRGDTYGHGNFIEVQLQVAPGTELPVGTTLYTTPQPEARRVTEEVASLPTLYASRGEAVAWEYTYFEDGVEQIAHSATPFLDTWIAAKKAKVRPLYTTPTPDARVRELVEADREYDAAEIAWDALDTRCGIGDTSSIASIALISDEYLRLCAAIKRRAAALAAMDQERE